MENRLLLLMLFLSGFVFGQNVEILTQANHSDENFVKEFSAYLLPNYKLNSSSKTGVNQYYSYLPADIKDEELKQCNLGNECKNEVTLIFKNVNSVFKFDSAIGKGEALKEFWSKNIQQITPAKSDNFIYKNSADNIWWNFFSTGKKWMIRNMSDRSKPWSN